MPGRVRGLCQVPYAGGEAGPWQYQHPPARHISIPPWLSVPTGQQWRGVPARAPSSPRCPALSVLTALKGAGGVWGPGAMGPQGGPCHGSPGLSLPQIRTAGWGGMTEQV